MKGNDNTPLMKGKLIKNKDEDKKVLCSKKRWWCQVPIAQVVIIPTTIRPPQLPDKFEVSRINQSDIIIQC